MSSGVGITLMAVGAILRFALGGGSPHGRGGYYNLPGPNARLQRTRQAAAEDVAEVRGDDRFYAPDAPGREEDDL